MEDKRVLIVDDEVLFAMDLEARLKVRGYQVAGLAARGEEAVKLARETDPDCILMDIRLAGNMDGITAAEKIREFSRAPIVFITGYSSADILDCIADMPDTQVLNKPFTSQDLIQFIN
ncbi:MAG: response regulator [Spirochaetia bacterium]